MDNKFVLLVVILSNFILPAETMGNRSTPMQRLISDLFAADYIPYANPLLPGETKVQIEFEFNLISLKKLDIKEEIMDIRAQLVLFWHDPRLMWNESEYDDISSILAANKLFWLPEITAFIPFQNDPKHIELNSAGMVTWRHEDYVTTLCDINVQNFPYDDQICYFKMGGYEEYFNYTYFGPTEFVNETIFDENGQWTLVTSTYVVYESGYCQDYYYFFVQFARKPEYYEENFLIYANMLYAIFIFLVIIPLAMKDKLEPILEILLAVALLLTVCSDMIPETSDGSPIINRYLKAMMFSITMYFGFYLAIALGSHFHNKREQESETEDTNSVQLHNLGQEESENDGQPHEHQQEKSPIKCLSIFSVSYFVAMILNIPVAIYLLVLANNVQSQNLLEYVRNCPDYAY